MKKIVISILTLVLAIGSIQLSAQCHKDRHSTNWYDGWVSCDASPSPNPSRAVSHWILYDFGDVYELGKMHIWNYNDPTRLDMGIQGAMVDFSVDGVEWTDMGAIYVPQASGETLYAGEEVTDFEGAAARYVLITAASNYGGNCFGLSEVRIATSGVVATEEPALSEDCLKINAAPNPFNEQTRIQLLAHCDVTMYYSIRDALGKVIIPEQKFDRSVEFNFGDEKLATGVYFLAVRYGDKAKQYRVVKM